MVSWIQAVDGLAGYTGVHVLMIQYNNNLMNSTGFYSYK